VTPAIDAVVLKSLAKTADQRYQSATEMRADIERVLDGRPTEAQTAVLGAANMPTQRLDPRQVGAAAAVGQTRAMPAVETPTGYQQPATGRYDEEYADGPGGRPPAGPPRRPESRRAPEPEKSGRTGYIILAVAGIAAVIAAILLAKSLLKSGGNASQKQVPDFGTGQLTVAQAQAMVQQQEYSGYTLTGNGEDCPAGTDRHQGQAGTIIAQNPAANGYQKPGPISYCLSQGPQLGAVPDKATLNKMNEGALKASLGAAKFNLSNPVVIHQNDDNVPLNNIIDVFDASNGGQTSIAGQKNVDVSKVTIGWIISDGKKKSQLSWQNFVGQNPDTVVGLIKNEGFANVQKLVDTSATSQQPNTVTRVTPAEGSYSADQQIIVYYAPQPVQPTTPTSTQCDPATDPNQCQGNPTTPATTPGGPPGQGSTNPACLLNPAFCPSTSNTKKGG
jgi:serine/threonine-protein kinase